jgi:hypothetical protein
MGKIFTECEKLVKRNLVKTGFDEYLFLESKNWTGKRSFNLKKNQVVMIPENMKNIRVGLGWDTFCDIDSSIILMD